MAPQFERIDSHVHSYEGVKAPDSFMKYMEELGLSAVGIASLPCGIVGKYSGYETTSASLLAKLLHPGKFYSFHALEYRKGSEGEWMSDFKAQAQTALAAGADGIKMLEGKPDVRKGVGLPLDSSEYDEFYSFLEDGGVPLLLHVADPEEFWDRDKAPAFAFKHGWFWGDGTYPSKETLYQEVEGMLRKHPRLNITLAHFFFLSADVARAEDFLSRHPNVSFDITPGVEMYFNFARRREEWREFFVRNFARIIYGSDGTDKQSSWEWSLKTSRNVQSFLETDGESEWGRGIKLDAKSLGRIYSGNFKERVGGAPKPVRKDAALNFSRKALESAKQAGAGHSVSQLEKIIERLMDI